MFLNYALKSEKAACETYSPCLGKVAQLAKLQHLNMKT